MHNNIISIIIPTLNEEKLILQVLNQFDTKLKEKFNFEIIVSDGGSKDSTVRIINGLADKVLIHKENFKQNISQGRNQGALNSKGDVLIFLNADTLISDVKLFFEKIFEIFENDNIVALTCPVRVFKNEELIKDKIFHFFYNNVMFLNKFIMGMGRGECHIIRRNAFIKAGYYNEKMYAGEDFDLYKRLKKIGRIVFLKDIIIYESPRRYRKFGYMKVFWDWTRNSIWITLFKKSISKVWEEVR
ncbi:MAG: glycosyltransferase [Ignavibacteria bacterium]|jgi:glycosyltransferase involved in cell wall biosynthesis